MEKNKINITSINMVTDTNMAIRDKYIKFYEERKK